MRKVKEEMKIAQESWVIIQGSVKVIIMTLMVIP